MKVVITGGFGFLGWHTACRLRARYGLEATRLGRQEMADQERLHTELAGADVVLHLAGVNRAASDAEVTQGNVEIAQRLADAIAGRERPIRVVYANSIQADLDNAYGLGKAESALILTEAVRASGGSIADVLLPNLFGEHGRPHYNSFVATFCHLVATGKSPTVELDKEVSLLHAQEAAECLLNAMAGDVDVQIRPRGTTRKVSDVRDLIVGFHALYVSGDIPSLDSPFITDLFNTYRSYAFPQGLPLHPKLHSDARGELVEVSRSHGGAGQVFVSTTRPGFTRGDHYHLSKIERFFVVRGEAEISLRRLLDDEVVTFTLSGDEPGFVDMPTLWVHNIANVGDTDLVTVFWSDQLLDRENPDQYPERVQQEESA